MRIPTALALALSWASLLPGGPAAGQLRLPEHVEVIDAPTDRNYFQFGDVLLGAPSLHGTLLIINGAFRGDGCAPLGADACPAVNLYERSDGTWQRTKSIEIADGGLASGTLLSDSAFAVQRSMSGDAGAPQFRDVQTWRLDRDSGEWLPDPSIRHQRWESLAVTEDLILIAFQHELAFYEYAGGSWFETGTRPAAQHAYSSPERLVFGKILHIGAENAYVEICREPRVACTLEHKVAVLDLATRTFTEPIDIAPFAAPFPAYTVGIVRDTMAVKKHHSSTTSFYEPIKLYSRIGGVWQQTHETHLAISPEGLTTTLLFDGSTIMEEFTAFFYHSYASYAVIYRPDSKGDWGEVGRIMFPGGDQFLSSVRLPSVSQKAAVFSYDAPRPGAGRVLYIEDYEYYHDSDQDGMPAGWEEKYGFSDHSFDDFTRDSDGDGISDRDEFVLITSPIDADTDGDELPDQWELMASLDPTDPSDAGTDIDGDGYSALEEYRAGTDPLNRESKPDSSSSDPEQGGSGGGGSMGLSLAVLVLYACFGRTVRRRESAVMGSITAPRSIAPSAPA